ncbi:MAG: hypothetical protein HY898_23775 [Deltaproteobacteria bacterium]|nr:hypothetical protein [Deltaproteobacteria bacterium]
MEARNLASCLVIMVAVGCGGSVITGGTAGDDGGTSGNGGSWHTDGGGPGGKGGYGGTHGDGAGPGGSGGTNTGGMAGTGGWGDGAGGYGGWSDGTGGYAGAPGKLGAKCKSDGDCGNLVCLTPTSQEFLGGGPAGGYCSKECTSDSTACEAYDPDAICVDVRENSFDPPKSYCLRGCVEGPPLESGTFGKFDPKKCWGRHDVACKELVPSVFACLPVCQTDKECGTLKCDPRRNVCTDNPTLGLPMGAGCREWAQSNGDAGPECAGLCLGVPKGDDASSTDPLNIAYFCTQSCVFGDIMGCGFNDTPSAGFCLYSAPTSGNGDEAFCAAMCDKDSDCLDQQDNNGFCDTDWVNSLGRGLCAWNYGL